MTDTEALAEKIAAKLEGYSVAAVGDIGDLAEDIIHRTLPAKEELELLRAIDRRVFLCKSCGYWHRQIYNATPDAAEWECMECHDDT